MCIVPPPRQLAGVPLELNMTFSPCVCNELAGLIGRHLAPTPKPVSHYIWEQAFAALEAKWPQPVLEPWSVSQVLSTRTTRTKRKFAKAASDLVYRPICKDDAKVNAFCKVEKHPATKLACKWPRMIQYRNARFTYKLCSWLGPLEHWWVKGCPNTPFAKGLNQVQRARQLRALFKSVPDAVAVGLDHNNFDAHESWEALRAQNKYYERRIRGDKCELLRILRWRLKYKGKTRNGWRYTSDGRRVSGDYDTSLGNTTVNLAFIAGVMSRARVPQNRWNVVADGDDCVVVLSRRYLQSFLTSLEHAARWGMDTRIEFISDDINDVEFCQGKVLDLGFEKRLIRKPGRVLQRAGVCLRKFTGNGYRKWLYSVGECELACNAGVPILQEYAEMLMRCSGVSKGISNPEVTAAMRGATHTKAMPITDFTRNSFSRVFGVSKAEQLYLEGVYKKMASIPELEALVNGQRDRFDIVSLWQSHVVQCPAP